jgi:cytochrome c2
MRKFLPFMNVLLILAACHPQDENTARELTGGDPARGEHAIARYGCGACHEIPGIDNATGLIGPSLAKIADRVMLAGQLPNQPDNMIKWIQNPQSAAPGTAMPDMHVSDEDARDIAAYLYTLRMDR